MSVGKGNCAICGKPLVYYRDAREMTCVTCGKRELGHSVCEDGHYVCDNCYRAGGVSCIMDVCLHATSANPIEIAMRAMDDNRIYPNGPEHHTLTGAALLAGYANAGGELDLENGLAELRTRSLDVPGGACGFWGVCGSATSAGQAMSIIVGATPMSREPWALCQRLTSEILANIAELGGPRCCKRTCFTAITTAVPFFAEATGVQMELPDQVVCAYYDRNHQCLREDCPYFSASAL